MASKRDPAAEERERLERFLEWRRAVGRERRPRRWRWLANVAGILVLGVIVAALSSLLAGDLGAGRKRLETPAPLPMAERRAAATPPPVETTAGTPPDTASPDVTSLETAEPASSDRAADAVELPPRPDTALRPRSTPPPLLPPPIVGAGKPPLPASLPQFPASYEQPRVPPHPESVPRGGFDAFDERSRPGTPAAPPAPATVPPVSRAPVRVPPVPTAPAAPPLVSRVPNPAPATRPGPGPRPTEPEVTPKILPQPVETLRRLIEHIPDVKAGRAIVRWIRSQRQPDPGSASPAPRSPQTR